MNNIYANSISANAYPLRRINHLALIIYTFTLCTTYSFISSNGIKIALLYLSIAMFSYSILLAKKELYFKIIDILIIFFLTVFLVNITLKVDINNLIIFDTLIFIGVALFILIAKLSVEQYEFSYKIIKIFAVLYALGSIFQYYFINIYNQIILPLFSETERILILRQMSWDLYAGFTFQVSYTAGYIVFGIGVLFFTFYNKDKRFTLLLNIIAIIILLFGLLLTGKRAHTLFMFMSLLFTYIYAFGKKRIFIRTFKTIMIIITFLLLMIFVMQFYNVDQNSPISGFVNRINETVNGIRYGEDITSGRILLYQFSWEIFKESPILGGGWWEVRNNSIGLINDEKGSHPHNIYIQVLSELGIIGFFSFLIIVIYTYAHTLKLFNHRHVTNNKKVVIALQISLYLQTFFILYGLTGNLLTDHNFLLAYFYAISLIVAVFNKLRNIKELENE